MTDLDLDADGLAVREADLAPGEVLALLNADPDFVDASTLNTGKRAFDTDDAEMFLWQSEMTENSRLLGARDRTGSLVAVITLLVPHADEGQPWIGALLLRDDAELDTIGTAVLDALETRLAERGWRTLGVSPMTGQRRRLGWFGSRGYRPGGVRSDNDKRAVLVVRKAL